MSDKWLPSTEYNKTWLSAGTIPHAKVSAFSLVTLRFLIIRLRSKSEDLKKKY